MNIPGIVAILGSGSWSTAIAKIVQDNDADIWWYMRNPQKITEFKQLGHNPTYLSSVRFNLDRIHFTDDINEAIRNSDMVIFGMPSPYLRQHVEKITESFTDKMVISIIKGIVQDLNIPISQYLTERFSLKPEQFATLSGPSHAEEVAWERLTYLTVGCPNTEIGQEIADFFQNHYVHTTVSEDVIGVQFAGVLKNIYAIASGISIGLKYGDNFQAVLISSASRELEHFLDVVHPFKRNVKDSVYLGDLMVTAYSKFSRNRSFGTMIGQGYSVKSAQIEMQMIAEGYYGTRCITLKNMECNAEIPIVNAVYNILYKQASPLAEFKRLIEVLK